MRRESHVRFCERLGVKLPGSTHHSQICEASHICESRPALLLWLEPATMQCFTYSGHVDFADRYMYLARPAWRGARALADGRPWWSGLTDGTELSTRASLAGQ